VDLTQKNSAREHGCREGILDRNIKQHASGDLENSSVRLTGRVRGGEMSSKVWALAYSGVALEGAKSRSVYERCHDSGVKGDWRGVR
jgi:hypothetical protein